MIVYNYDALGKLISKDYGGDLSDDIVYLYFGQILNKVEEYINGNLRSIQYSYDSFFRLSNSSRSSFYKI